MEFKNVVFLIFSMCLLAWTLKGEIPELKEEFSIFSSGFGSGDRRLYSLVVTKDRKVIGSDLEQNELMLVSLQTQARIGKSFVLDNTPLSLALLSDGLVAVTTLTESIIHFVDVSTTEPQLVSTVTTARKYSGITGGPGDTLIVGAEEDPNSLASARIDILSRDGHVIRTIFDGTNSTEIESPECLKFFNDSVYVSDSTQGRLHRLKIDSGELERTFNGVDLSKLQMNEPAEIDFDEVGNMYVAIYSGRICCYLARSSAGCVIVVTRDGEVEKLVHRRSRPSGLSMTPTGIIVSWVRKNKTSSFTELTAYSILPSTRLPKGLWIPTEPRAFNTFSSSSCSSPWGTPDGGVVQQLSGPCTSKVHWHLDPGIVRASPFARLSQASGSPSPAAPYALAHCHPHRGRLLRLHKQRGSQPHMDMQNLVFAPDRDHGTCSSIFPTVVTPPQTIKKPPL